jgi:hypothetical protein
MVTTPVARILRVSISFRICAPAVPHFSLSVTSLFVSFRSWIVFQNPNVR